jgi:hypothetical protein
MNETTAVDRRRFLSQLGTVAAAGAALTAAPGAADTPPATGTAQTPAAPPSPALPTIALGKHQVTRLVVGSNPFNGNSYLGPNLDRHMREYYTIDRIVEFLESCEKAGINTHQFSASASDKAAHYIPKLRERGSRLSFFPIDSRIKEIKKVVEQTSPIAMVHHGSATDQAFFDGKLERVHDYVKAVHDQGLLAGISTHCPDCVRQIADAGWGVDFFMTCLYFFSRKTFGKDNAAEPETIDARGPFYKGDPAVMTAVVRQTKLPCFAFKILAAGRAGSSQQKVREAFRFAYQNIKPSDGVIVGMFPQYFDELRLNVGYAREFA